MKKIAYLAAAALVVLFLWGLWGPEKAVAPIDEPDPASAVQMENELYGNDEGMIDTGVLPE